MRRIFIISVTVVLLLAVASCAPVIRRDLMDAGIRNVPLSEVRHNPDSYKGKLFILGGVIAGTRVTPEGSLVEALHVRVDSLGYLTGGVDGRYLALFPKEGGILDPLIFRGGKRITVAAEFLEVREGMLDESKYAYPYFEIRQIHLWEDSVYYYPPQHFYYPYYWWGYPYPWWGGPYWRYDPFWW